jgi:RNA polymerase sigma-70 factor (ECF subfamily)
MPPAATASSVPDVLEDATLARARAGDDGAFAALVRKHQTMVFGLAYHFLRDRGRAEELAQEVFLALYQNISRIESAGHVTFWLRRVTSNRCIDCVRRLSHRFERLMSRIPEPFVAGSSSDPFLAALLQELVAELPPRPRMVVTLRYQEDLDPLEIASILNIPVNTVKSHLRRSMNLMRKKLEARGYRDES